MEPKLQKHFPEVLSKPSSRHGRRGRQSISQEPPILLPIPRLHLIPYFLVPGFSDRSAASIPRHETRIVMITRKGDFDCGVKRIKWVCSRAEIEDRWESIGQKVSFVF